MINKVGICYGCYPSSFVPWLPSKLCIIGVTVTQTGIPLVSQQGQGQRSPGTIAPMRRLSQFKTKTFRRSRETHSCGCLMNIFPHTHTPWKLCKNKLKFHVGSPTTLLCFRVCCHAQKKKKKTERKRPRKPIKCEIKTRTVKMKF